MKIHGVEIALAEVMPFALMCLGAIIIATGAVWHIIQNAQYRKEFRASLESTHRIKFAPMKTQNGVYQWQSHDEK